MKPATISLVSVIATLGTVAAIGFAQPDGIDPPAGPVSDTQPSLTSIDSKLDTISNSFNSGPNQLVQFEGLGPQSQTQLSLGNVRLIRVIMQQGKVTVSDAGGFTVNLSAGGTFDVNGPQRQLVDFSNELDVDLVGPITVTGLDSQNSSYGILVYKELP